ncbi:MAG: hypothetical protein MUC87_18945 [Bacteroidia bacterium]|jgi:hypothetical protein|nr:hypothetical protein [Bacteroidia bacterium]
MPLHFLFTKKRLLTALLWLCSVPFFAQGDMRFFGTATKGGQALPGANVSVLMDGRPLLNLTTGRNGKFRFTVDLGHQYRIDFTSPGCVPMYMVMDLRVPRDKGWIYPDYVCEIPFFVPNDPRVRTEQFAQKPFAKVIFDGNKGFHDDPKWNFTSTLFKNPEEERQKQLQREAEERARIEEEERKRKQLLEEEQRVLAEEAKRKQQATATVTSTPTVSPSLAAETEAQRLERERLEKEQQQQTNQQVKKQYENNLLKLAAESERQNNVQKFDKMKGTARGNSAVQALRVESEVKAQAEYVREQQQQQQRQQQANKQVKDAQVKKLQETAAKVQRDANAARLKPVAQMGTFQYEPSPTIVVTFVDDIFSDVKTTLVSWPGGKKVEFRAVMYWWGATYYYRDGLEIDEKTYKDELTKYRKS